MPTLPDDFFEQQRINKLMGIYAPYMESQQMPVGEIREYEPETIGDLARSWQNAQEMPSLHYLRQLLRNVAAIIRPGFQPGNVGFASVPVWSAIERGIYEGRIGNNLTHVIERRGRDYLISEWGKSGNSIGLKAIGRAKTLQEAKDFVSNLEKIP